MIENDGREYTSNHLCRMISGLLRHASQEQVFYAYTYGTAGWLGMQAVLLIVMPKLVVAMLASGVVHETTGRLIHRQRSLEPMTLGSHNNILSRP